MSGPDVSPPASVAHELARLLFGMAPNGTKPAQIAPPWRSIVSAVAMVDPSARDAALAAALDAAGFSQAETHVIRRVILAHSPLADAPGAEEDWFSPQALDALMQQNFAPVRYAVPDVIQEGLTLFAAPPKLGKTYLMLHLGLAITNGGYAFGMIRVDKGEVLFLSLEDGPRRVQRRVERLLGGAATPAGFHLLYRSRTLEDGLLDRLEGWMAAHPETRLIVIDTFARIRSRQHRDDSVYLQDYDALQPLQEFAKRNPGLAVVVIHHTRKMGADDVIETVSGSNGLTGVADAVLVLQRGRGEHEAVLHILGKDMDEEASKAFKYDPAIGTYTLLGDAAEVLRTKERREVIAAIRAANRRLSPKEITERLGLPAGTVRKRLHDMLLAGDLDCADGKYGVMAKPTTFGNAGNGDNGGNTRSGGIGGNDDDEW